MLVLVGNEKMSMIMKNIKYSVLALALIAGLFSACSTLGIDSLFSFNINKSFDFPVVPLTPVGQFFTSPAIPIGLDSATLAKNNTSLSLIKTVKLTKLAFVSSDSIAYPVKSFDTIILAVADGVSTSTLATYSGAVDSVTLSGLDFEKYVKNPNGSFLVSFKAKKAPLTTVNFTANLTLTFNANPLR